MNDQGFRNLALLDASASTARVLNLRRVLLQNEGSPEITERPFFATPALNRTIIVKHHLRINELDCFDTARNSATKLLLPIDHFNLRAGAKFVFIGQRDYRPVMEAEFGSGRIASADMELLRFLDELPSFDPFLLREQLKSRGVTPAACFFTVSEADTQKMTRFAQAEIQPLVDSALSGSMGASDILARKLLSNVNDATLAPLRQVLLLEGGQFAEGVFCWKAFLYYKWRLLNLTPAINALHAELATVRPVRRPDAELAAEIGAARVNLQRALETTKAAVGQTLSLYDIAYDRLINAGNARAFRDFLLEAPAHFGRLGEDLAAIDHMVSFWRFRFPEARQKIVTADELAAIFRDFETGLRICAAAVEPAPQRLLMAG